MDDRTLVAKSRFLGGLSLSIIFKDFGRNKLKD